MLQLVKLEGGRKIKIGELEKNPDSNLHYHSSDGRLYGIFFLEKEENTTLKKASSKKKLQKRTHSNESYTSLP